MDTPGFPGTLHLVNLGLLTFKHSTQRLSLMTKSPSSGDCDPLSIPAVYQPRVNRRSVDPNNILKSVGHAPLVTVLTTPTTGNNQQNDQNIFISNKMEMVIFSVCKKKTTTLYPPSCTTIVMHEIHMSPWLQQLHHPIWTV